MQVKRLGRLLLVPVFFLSGSLTGLAQTSGNLRGIVEDETGIAIAAAEVMITGKTAQMSHTTGNEMGEFIFTGLTPGVYVLRAEATNFKPAEMKVTLGTGTPPLQHIRLKIASASQEITVTASDPVSMDGNVNSVEVNHDLLKSLPVRDDNPLAAAQVFLDPASSGAEGTKIVVDGVEASDLDVPSSSIKSVAVNRNPYSAEFGRPGKGRIEVVTRPGSLTRVHHHFVLTYRNASLDARNAFATAKPQMSRSFWESDVNGPLPGHKGSFYIGGEFLHDDQNAVIRAFTSTGLFAQNVPSPERNGKILGRVDYQLNPSNSLSVRYNFNRDSFGDLGIGPFDLPQRGYKNTAERNEIRLGETALVSVNFSNELRFAYKKRNNTIKPLSDLTTNLVLGAFNSGGAQRSQDQNEGIFEWQDVATWVHGKHTLHFGATVKRRELDTVDASNFGGTFTFSDLDAFADHQPFLFAINQGNPAVQFGQNEYSYFVQDEMRLRQNLTLMVGLRHELQSGLRDHNNLAPRFGISYAPGHGPVIRAGGGIFYDRRPWTMQEQALLYDNQHVRRLVIQNPVLPLPPDALNSVPPSLTSISPLLVAPYQIQASVGMDQKIGKKNFLSVEYTAIRGLRLFRTRDTNAPLPETGVRPNPAFVNLDQFESSGSSTSNSLAVTYRTAIANQLELLAQYTLSRAFDNTSGMFIQPADNFHPGAEWGRSDFDRRHRLNLAAIFQLPRGLKLGTITTIGSAIPFNITTGHDANQDGVANDRPAGVGRNTGVGPMYSDVDIRFSKKFVLVQREHGSKYLELRADAFNAFNRVNATNYIGVLSSPLFGRANSALPARQIQISMKFSF
jgi:hypothetical protein